MEAGAVLESAWKKSVMKNDEFPGKRTGRQRAGWRRVANQALCLFAVATGSYAEPLENVGVTVSLSAAERRSFLGATGGDDRYDFPTIDYIEKTEQGTLRLTPRLLITEGFASDQRTFDYLALLQKGGPVDALQWTGEAEFTFMFPSLDVRLVNNSQRKLLISEVMVKVASSESDRRPLPFLAEGTEVFIFHVLNEGWAPMESCSVKFSISPREWKREPVPQFEKNLGRLDRSAAVDVSRELVQAGLSPQWVEREKKFREEDTEGEPDEELMKPFSATAYLAGVLSYSWRGQGGSLESHSVRFRVGVPLWVGPLGGGAAVAGRYEAMLRADGRDYAVPIPVSHRVDPGTTTRLLVRLGIPRTSRHRFNLQLRTTRGETVESGTIALDGLLPPTAAKQLEAEAAARKNPPSP